MLVLQDIPSSNQEKSFKWFHHLTGISPVYPSWGRFLTVIPIILHDYPTIILQINDKKYLPVEKKNHQKQTLS